MATTTNYSWTTPDDTALVKDGAAAIRTLGSSIDTTTKALNPSTTLGDIEYRSSTANTNTRLGVGSAGQVLTVSGGVPSWASPAGGGKLLQVVTAAGTATNIATTTFTDITLSASITPTLNTSKVFAIVTVGYQTYRAAASQGWAMRLVRGSTTIWTTDAVVGMNFGTMTSPVQMHGLAPITYLDSPATTSATTYKIQARLETTANSSQIDFNSSQPSQITLFEIGA